MNIKAGAARMMKDGSGDASVTVVLNGSKKHQVRVVRGMDPDDAWFLYIAHGTPTSVRLIHWAAAKDCPSSWERVVDSGIVQEVMAKGREVMADPRLQRAVLKAITKRQERERRRSVQNKALNLRADIHQMFRVGATVEEIMDAVNEAIVKGVQEA